MSSDPHDLVDDDLGRRLTDANPYEPEALDDHLPPRSGDLFLREITAGDHRSLLDRLLGRPGGATGGGGLRLPARAAFVGVVAAIALLAVGLNLGLARSGDEVALPGVDGDGTEPPVTTEAGASVSDAVPPTIAPGAETDSGASSTPAVPTPTEPAGTAEDSTAADAGPTADDGVAPAGEALGCVVVDVELLELTGGWRVGYDNRVGNGAFITWEGLAPEEHNTSPTDVIEAEITIAEPGTYRFVWSMRQPFEVSDESADSSWVDFPDADRFGPVDGGSYVGFVEVAGRAKGEFDWAALARDDGGESPIAVEFDEAGTYTLRLAGRSHGHEIDRIVLYPEALSDAEALSDRCGAG